MVSRDTVSIFSLLRSSVLALGSGTGQTDRRRPSVSDAPPIGDGTQQQQQQQQQILAFVAAVPQGVGSNGLHYPAVLASSSVVQEECLGRPCRACADM